MSDLKSSKKCVASSPTGVPPYLIEAVRVYCCKDKCFACIFIVSVVNFLSPADMLSQCISLINCVFVAVRYGERGARLSGATSHFPAELRSNCLLRSPLPGCRSCYPSSARQEKQLSAYIIVTVCRLNSARNGVGT